MANLRGLSIIYRGPTMKVSRFTARAPPTFLSVETASVDAQSHKDTMPDTSAAIRGRWAEKLLVLLIRKST